jgi:hypothetical protein
MPKPNCSTDACECILDRGILIYKWIPHLGICAKLAFFATVILEKEAYGVTRSPAWEKTG